MAPRTYTDPPLKLILADRKANKDQSRYAQARRIAKRHGLAWWSTYLWICRLEKKDSWIMKGMSQVQVDHYMDCLSDRP